MITGNDNEKASVGFKAFGLRTEGSCADFAGLLGFWREVREACLCFVCVDVWVSVCVDGLNHRMLLRKMRNRLHQDMRNREDSLLFMHNQVKTEK